MQERHSKKNMEDLEERKIAIEERKVEIEEQRKKVYVVARKE
jgi:hypothetical protein